MPEFLDDGRRYLLDTPTLAPQASAFLWNRKMMLQVSCRGYAVAQFMQPEPTKYAHVPTLAGTHFMLPEQQYFTHHPGRFFYVRDDESGALFSAPYEPVRAPLERFEFLPGQSDIRWRTGSGGIALDLCVTLTEGHVVECWEAVVRNESPVPRRVSVVPYFPVGFSSWMNMSGAYEPALQGIVARRVAPYQKTEDYFKSVDFKELTFLVADRSADAWEANQAAFEGEGHLGAPAALKTARLQGGVAEYEQPTCALQYQFQLAPGEQQSLRLLFGAAKDEQEITALAKELLSPAGAERGAKAYAAAIAAHPGCLQIEAPDADFQHFVNHWLPRQVYYHGDTQRLSTDPQTRNYVQDAMGLVYVKPSATRHNLVFALSHQEPTGQMPDGIVLVPGASLKYINQIPHTDHCVWLVICAQAYLSETADFALLDEEVPFCDGSTASVFEHLKRSLRWLLAARDERGLSYIAQGDWCDPMNMVGYRGKGVSAWLTEALAYGLGVWAAICREHGQPAEAAWAGASAGEVKQALNAHLWDGDWYARGITDDGVTFGVSADPEGRIFLNPQSWALLCEAPDADRKARLLAAVDRHLATPFGVQLLSPAYTRMREDVGRVTQKFPGTAENGSIYNHAAAFYAAALYHAGESDRAYDVLRRMIPGPDIDDLAQRGQVPVFIPNYYRGAFRERPRTAGRSSQLFNTGTAAWFYRSVVEALFGLRGTPRGLSVAPNLPAAWSHANVVRTFRGAEVAVAYRRVSGLAAIRVTRAGQVLEDGELLGVTPGARYELLVELPDPVA